MGKKGEFSPKFGRWWRSTSSWNICTAPVWVDREGRSINQLSRGRARQAVLFGSGENEKRKRNSSGEISEWSMSASRLTLPAPALPTEPVPLISAITASTQQFLLINKSPKPAWGQVTAALSILGTMGPVLPGDARELGRVW